MNTTRKQCSSFKFQNGTEIPRIPTKYGDALSILSKCGEGAVGITLANAKILLDSNTNWTKTKSYYSFYHALLPICQGKRKRKGSFHYYTAMLSALCCPPPPFSSPLTIVYTYRAKAPGRSPAAVIPRLCCGRFMAQLK